MRVLVTGATGFLGGHVVRHLSMRGDAVTAHGWRRRLPGLDTLTGDLADPEDAARILTSQPWEAVVNLAGPVTSGNEDLTTGIDVVTTHLRIALHVRRYVPDARIVHASSMTVYGTPATINVDEDHPRRPTHLYGLAKSAAEDILLADPALDVWLLRLPGLFSEARASGALYHFCRAARERQPLRVTTPMPTPWSILHVDDAATAVLQSLEAPGRRGGALNVSHDESIDLLGVARLVAQLGGSSSVDHPAGVIHPALKLVNEKARQRIGWRPTPLRERITTLYEAYAAA